MIGRMLAEFQKALILWDINQPPWFISKKYTKKEMISPHSHPNFSEYCPKTLLEGEKYTSMKDSFWWYETYLYALLTL